MSVESVSNNPKITTIKRQPNKVSNKQQTFTGSFNPVVTLMDAIDRGGFAASFIAQDGIGMVAPRIYEGLNRNREKDENGKKTGPLNWEFARREGIREVLSGPSAFLIPMGIMHFIKKFSGTANNVHVSHINALGNVFGEFASANPEKLADTKAFKKGYYSKVFENVLSESTDKTLTGDALRLKADAYTNKLLEAEEFYKKASEHFYFSNEARQNRKVAKKLISELTHEFMDLRKSTTEATNSELEAIMHTGKTKNLHTTFSRLLQSMTDYTNDAIEKTAKNGGTTAEEIKSYVSKFNLHRAGTRVVSNLGMWGTVVGFYALIPKLYNLGLKHDPGLKGLEPKTDENKDKKDVSFTGNVLSKVGETAVKDGTMSKLLTNFEFNGPSMPVNAMMTLLFGFTLPARYSNAKSDKERKEILVRDISSFAAILFAAKALARGFSKLFSKASGFALNITPADHSKGILNKLKNYFTPNTGIEVLSSEQIVSKYSNLDKYRDGINGFFKFIRENGGDVKRILNVDRGVKENADKIVKKYIGKSLKDASFEDIDKAFEKARLEKISEPLENIYSIFSAKDNKFINRAKTMNSAFGFASTLVLVPAFMMWLARYCEKMTRKAVAKEQEQQKIAQANNDIKPQNVVLTNKPTMQGFLNK